MLAFVVGLLLFPAPQVEPPVELESIIIKTTPGRQLFKEDVPCGDYFWKSQKADRGGGTMIYYFHGDPGWGKSKLDLYPRARYRVVVNEKKDPPTATVVKDEKGNFKEVKIQMTSRELANSRACFAPNPPSVRVPY